MQIESNQSKLSLGWLPLCIHWEFETNILFLIFLFVEPVPLSHYLLTILVVCLMLNSRCSAFLIQSTVLVYERRSCISSLSGLKHL